MTPERKSEIHKALVLYVIRKRKVEFVQGHKDNNSKIGSFAKAISDETGIRVSFGELKLLIEDALGQPL